MINYLFAGVLAAAVVAVGPAVAQTAQPAPAPFARASALIQSRADVAAQVRSLFERLDANRDGFIARAEIDARKANRGERRAMRMQRRGGSSGDRLPSRSVVFDRIDANRDGVISRDEFARAPMREEHRVTNNNGRREDRRVREFGTGRDLDEQRGTRGQRAMRMGGLRGRMIDVADANRDGRVSIQELTAVSYRRFDMIDANRDGQISPDERLQRRQLRRSQRRAG